MGVRKYNNSSSVLFAAPELYVSFKKSKELRIDLGRKSLGWNPASSFWVMGELFATKGFNLANDEEGGTTGLQITYKNKGGFFIQGVLSRYFIPQLNPGVEILDGGTIEAKSEWSAPPPRQVSFEGQERPIIYNIDMPSIGNFIEQNTFALAMGIDNSLGKIGLHAGRKPEPGARLNANGFLSLRNGGEVIVNARPFVNLQNFYGASWAKNWSKKLSTSLDYQYITPDRGVDTSFVFEGFSIVPKYTNVSYASFSSKWQGDFLSVSLSGLKAFKKYQSTNATFEKRLRWQDAVGFDVAWSPFEKILGGVRMQRDVKRRDNVMTSYFSWKVSKKTLARVHYQQIEAPSDQSFWSTYRANDLWEANLSYLF